MAERSVEVTTRRRQRRVDDNSRRRRRQNRTHIYGIRRHRARPDPIAIGRRVKYQGRLYFETWTVYTCLHILKRTKNAMSALKKMSRGVPGGGNL